MSMYMFNKKNKNSVSIIHAVKNNGEQNGYQCFGPFASCLLEDNFKEQHLKFINNPLCDSVSLDNTINNPKIEHEKARQALGTLFTEAQLSGACRFWKENRYKPFADCDKAQKNYIDAEKACLDTLNQYNH